jgi:hypothetical protein
MSLEADLWRACFTSFSLVSSPAIEALDSIYALAYALQPLTPLPSTPSGKLSIPLKLCLFNMSKYLKEMPFANEFIVKGGFPLLIKLITHGPSPTPRVNQDGKMKEMDGTGMDGTVMDGTAGRAEGLSGNSLAVSPDVRYVRT